jgi:hypothetical protein
MNTDVLKEEINHTATVEERKSHTVEEVFDELDTHFIQFYGEKGRLSANARRKEWNKLKKWNFKKHIKI